jgi:hypothetical protein
MRAGGAQKDAFADGCRTLVVTSAKAGVCPSQSDSIEEDFPALLIPNGEGHRQIQQAGLNGTRIARIQAPYNTRDFPFWNQPVAAESEQRSRQVKIVYICPQEAGAKWQRRVIFAHPSSTVLFSEILQTQNAVSMANPEV